MAQSGLFDVVIAGGGLSGSLIAWRLAQVRPDLAIALVERGERLGGNHTWSFHSTDVPAEVATWLAPLVTYSWDRQEVRFPRQSRLLRTGYRSITSERLHDVIAPALGEAAFFNAEIVNLSASGVTLGSGERLEGRAVIDARGQRNNRALTVGFQKFVGQEVEFETPHGLRNPIIMDATISQSDGYRFIYVLPFSATTALIEDTYYADGASIDHEGARRGIREYADSWGWRIKRVVREEEGILPIALAGDIEAHLADVPDGVGVAGLCAGLFHPLTGYSLPDAARLAHRIAGAEDLSGKAIAALTRGHADEVWRERAFFRLLSRLLYYAATPSTRYKVLARFYRLGEPLIERFYAAQSTQADKMRVLVGKPPVSFLRAMECVDEDRWLEQCWNRSVA
ncbi:MAG: lycopene beta-cyclase CrtY [Alphaproteobacteria bacterium]|nr:lycopene beta-cyclase CrtY [Alphaproteobacteria bacterium]